MSVQDDLLGLMGLFVAMADRGGVGAGARVLGLTQPSASRGLKRLEDRLGARLVERSTSSFVLTEEGSRFLEDARATLDAAEAAVERARAGASTLEGSITVAANVGLGALVLPALITSFQQTHPGVTITVKITEEPISMLREGVDLWVRVGPVPDESLIARRIRLMPRPVLAGLGVGNIDPEEDAAVAGLPWVGFRPFYEEVVPLLGPQGPRPIAIRPKLIVDNVFALMSLLETGDVVAMIPRFLVARGLTDGLVRELSPALRGEPVPWTLLFAPGKHRPARVQALADQLFAGLSNVD
jgi:DNA-binding transcriptional LysR family regulator